MEVYGHLSPDYVLREIDKLKLGIAPKAAEEAPIDESLLHPLLQASGEDSKAPVAPTEIASAAGAFQRAGDGGRTRDPRLGNRARASSRVTPRVPFSTLPSGFRVVRSRRPARRMPSFPLPFRSFRARMWTVHTPRL